MSYYGSYGSPIGEKYLGIWYDITDNGTTIKVDVEIWFKDANSGLTDSSNTLYFNMDATSATTSKGTVTVNQGNVSGIEIKIATYSYTYTKGTSAVKHNCAAKWVGVGTTDVTLSVTNSFTVPALDTYNIAYHANGGESAPYIQEKTPGQNIRITIAVPFRLGYKFINWNTAPDGSGMSYEAYDLYTTDADVTLYAMWEIGDCDIYIYKDGLKCEALVFVESDYVSFDKHGRVLANEFIEASGEILIGNTMKFAELIEK